MSTRTVKTGERHIATTGILSPYRPAHSESPYRLSYPEAGGWFFIKTGFDTVEAKSLVSANYGSSALQPVAQLLYRLSYTGLL